MEWEGGLPLGQAALGSGWAILQLSLAKFHVIPPSMACQRLLVCSSAGLFLLTSTHLCVCLLGSWELYRHRMGGMAGRRGLGKCNIWT